MQCSVVTALAVLCLTGHLHTGAGHTQEQRDSQGSVAADDSLLSSVAVDGHESLDSIGRRWNASQPTLPEEDVASETLKAGTATSLTWDAIITASQGVAPDVPDELVFTVDPEDDIVTTPHEVFITTPQDDFISTHQANNSITPQGDAFSILPEDITTTAQNIITSSREDVITTTQENITLQDDINTSLEAGGGGGDLKLKGIVTEPQLEDGRVSITIDQLVVCSCGEMTPDDCRRFLSGTTIDSKNDVYEDIRRPVADLKIVVHNVTCQKKDHRLMNFSEGQYYYRQRGDLVLRDAGYLTGLRVNDFCADLRPDKYGYMKWNVKICVAPPSVPRCCPEGQALTDGKCKDAITPAILEPPLAAGLHEKPIYWPVIENHYHPLNCTEHPLKSIPLVPDESTLLSVYYGILHVWIPSDGHVLRKYTYPPDLCIDGHVDTYGSVVYSANICYSYPEELHHRVCDGHICVRKCCQDDEEMNMALYRCVPSNRTSYQPRFMSPPYRYRIVNGKPLCPYHTVKDDAILDSRGEFYFNEESLSAKDYCVDKFNDGRGNIEDKTMICIKEPTKPWAKARKIAFPVCQMISVLFLMLTVGCYCLVPEILQGGGWYQLFHVLSLMLGYVSMFVQKMFSKTWGWNTCFAMGVVLQFGFLATFFWLNVLCFEVWRKIKSLNLFRPASAIPIWVYILYAFGVPVAIGTLTVCMQFFAPDDVPGLVKPNLAHSRCFFPDPVSLWLYFYGPIAFLFALNIVFITHTYWTYRKFDKNSAVLKKHSTENTGARKMEHTHRKRDYISDFKQQFSLLVLMSFCWVTELLSSLIPPLEMWAATDLLNTLQGFFIFFIFLANRSKRKHLKKKFPLIFKIAHHLRNAIRQCCCHSGKDVCLSPLSSFTSQVSRKLSSSSVVSNLSTLTSSLKFSTSSFSVTLPDNLDTKRPSVFEPDAGITVLSHSSLKINSLSPHENSDTQC